MRGPLITPAERQRIIHLRREPYNYNYKQIAQLTGRPYNTIAGALRDAGLQKEQTRAITIICDPAGLFQPGPTELNQADLSYMLSLSNLQDGFAFTIGQHHIEVRDGCYFRDDGLFCPPNKSSTLKWHELEGPK